MADTKTRAYSPQKRVIPSAWAIAAAIVGFSGKLNQHLIDRQVCYRIYQDSLTGLLVVSVSLSHTHGRTSGLSDAATRPANFGVS